MSPNETVAVVWDDVKMAALYFDRVLPLNDFDAMPSQIAYDYRSIEDVYVFLATEYYLPGMTAWEELVETIHSPLQRPRPDEMNVYNDQVISVCLALRRRGVNAVPLLSGHDWRFELLEPWYHEPPEGANPDVRAEAGWPTTRQRLEAIRALGDAVRPTEYIEVVFAGLPRPAAAETPWSDLMAFRDRRTSVELLRGFHLVLEAQAKGRDPDHVRRMVEDWLAALRRSARELRIDLVQETVHTVLNARSLMAGTVLAASGVMSGSTVAIGLGSALGVAGEMTEIGLTIAKQRRARTSWLHSAELGYVQHVDDAFGSTWRTGP